MGVSKRREPRELQLDVVDRVGLLSNRRVLPVFLSRVPFFLARSTKDFNNGTGQLNAPLECVWLCNDYRQNLMHCGFCAVPCMPSMALWDCLLPGPVPYAGHGGTLDVLDNISAYDRL